MDAAVAGACEENADGGDAAGVEEEEALGDALTWLEVVAEEPAGRTFEEQAESATSTAINRDVRRMRS